MDGLAFVNSSQDGLHLQHFSDTPVLRLSFNAPGTYILIARVVIRNDDGDPQDASARIGLKDGADVADTVQARIPGGGSYPFYLQGTMRLPPGESVLIDVRCSTYSGFAYQSSLFALQVSDLRFK
jgi:hypothetical protein